MEDVRGQQYPAPYRPPYGAPDAVGLYDPRFEHENCGVGFVAHIKGVRITVGRAAVNPIPATALEC